jgi:hypothetical protein
MAQSKGLDGIKDFLFGVLGEEKLLLPLVEEIVKKQKLSLPLIKEKDKSIAKCPGVPMPFYGDEQGNAYFVVYNGYQFKLSNLMHELESKELEIYYSVKANEIVFFSSDMSGQEEYERAKVEHRFKWLYSLVKANVSVYFVPVGYRAKDIDSWLVPINLTTSDLANAKVIYDSQNIGYVKQYLKEELAKYNCSLSLTSNGYRMVV